MYTCPKKGGQMKNKKRYLLTFIVIALCFTFMLSMIACDNKTTTEEEPVVVEQLFTNGTFQTVTGDSYPKVPTNWSASVGSSSSSSATPSGTDNLLAGVINVSEKQYNADKKKYGKVSNPGRAEGSDDKDQEVLMIYNKVLTSYKYTSSSISISKDSYYKLTLNVKTVGLAGKDGDNKYGAYMYVNGDAYAAYEAINTEGSWKQYTLFIESSKIKDGSITVALSLGIGDTSTGHMTSGHAYFDNIKLENLSDVKEGETAFTKADFDKVQSSNEVAKYSMQVGDTDFDYASNTTSKPYSASKYTGMSGFGSGNDANQGSSYLSKGIIDSTIDVTANGNKVEYIKAGDNFSERQLMINNLKATAYGFRSTVPVRFDNATVTKISLKVRTILTSGNAYIKFTDGTKTDAHNIVVKVDNTNGNWQTIDIIIQGNDLRANDLYLEMWLGQGGLNDKDTHAEGVAFFDAVTYTTGAVYTEGAPNNFTLKSQVPPQNISFDKFASANYEETVASDARAKVVNYSTGAGNWEDIKKANGFTFDDPKYITSNANGNVLILNNFLPNAFNYSTIFKTKTGDKFEDATKITANTISINPNSYYLISLWVKTSDIPKGKGLTIDLITYDEEKMTNKDFDTSVTVLKSLTGINSADTLEKLANKSNNDYVEARFYIQTNQSKIKNLGIRYTLGTGKNTQTDNMIMGTAFISNLTYEVINSSEYSNASTSIVSQKFSMLDSANSSEISSNGLFNFIDVTTTNNQYADIAKKASKKLWENGELKDYLGVPTGWTISNKSALIKDEQMVAGNLAGILQLANQKNNLTTIGLNGDPTYNDAKNILTEEKYPNVLAIKNNNNIASLGYTSNSISLNADSYYIFSVWAKAEAGQHFSIQLTTSSNTAPTTSDNSFVNVEGNGKWQQYIIYVQTGVSSISAKLGLYSGNITNDAVNKANEVYFTNATFSVSSKEAFTYYQDNKDDIAFADINAVSASWLEDAFDEYTIKENALNTPTNWTAELIDKDAPSDSDALASGIFNKTNGNWNLLNIDPDKNTDIVNSIFTDKVGDNVFTIYNKKPTAYQYNSKSASLKADTYYKISISVLTYGLKKDESATLTLKVNNKTYKFGKLAPSTDNDKKRVINTSTYDTDGKETIGKWSTYNFFVKTEKGVTPTAIMTLGLGYNDADGEANWRSGYVFADNYSVREIEEKDFIPGADTSEKPDQSIIAEDKIANNYRIVFTSEDAKAEEEPEKTETENKTDPYMWLWISSGVVGGVMIIVVVIYLIKKYAPKKKNKALVGGKKKSNKNKDKRDQFSK